ncbi:hypothetical protein ykris0001_28760 [Yersinia kristensenii ATCC 33638]|nr:hypothetical protein ykris0001_28760 [Yersinia kristensenii ATCC 33638]
MLSRDDLDPDKPRTIELGNSGFILAGSKEMQLSLQKITVWKASSTLILSKYSG